MAYNKSQPKKKGKWSSLIGKKGPQKKKIPGVKTGVSKAPKYKGAPLAPNLKKKKTVKKSVKKAGKLGSAKARQKRLEQMAPRKKK
jgi:hypothetical protein